MQHSSNSLAGASLAFVRGEFAAGIEFGAVNSPFFIQVHNSDISNAAFFQSTAGQLEQLSRLTAHFADNSIQVEYMGVI